MVPACMGYSYSIPDAMLMGWYVVVSAGIGWQIERFDDYFKVSAICQHMTIYLEKCLIKSEDVKRIGIFHSVWFTQLFCIWPIIAQQQHLGPVQPSERFVFCLQQQTVCALNDHCSANGHVSLINSNASFIAHSVCYGRYIAHQVLLNRVPEQATEDSVRYQIYC